MPRCRAAAVCSASLRAINSAQLCVGHQSTTLPLPHRTPLPPTICRRAGGFWTAGAGRKSEQAVITITSTITQRRRLMKNRHAARRAATKQRRIRFFRPHHQVMRSNLHIGHSRRSSSSISMHSIRSDLRIGPDPRLSSGSTSIHKTACPLCTTRQLVARSRRAPSPAAAPQTAATAARTQGGVTDRLSAGNRTVRRAEAAQV